MYNRAKTIFSIFLSGIAVKNDASVVSGEKENMI